MPRKKKTKVPDVETVMDRRVERFERGQDELAPGDLDADMREFGDYEGQEVVPRPEPDSDPETPPAEEEYFPRSLLRLEIVGRRAEIVCGSLESAARERVERFAKERGVSVSDIWYDEDEIMRDLVPSWTAWYDLDQFFHESGMLGYPAQEFALSVRLDGEPVEAVDPARVRSSQLQPGRPPRAPGTSAVCAGVAGLGRCVFELDIDGEFDPSRLKFVFIDLAPLGIPEKLLTEILYDGKPMAQEEPDDSEFLKVTFP